MDLCTTHFVRKIKKINNENEPFEPFTFSSTSYKYVNKGYP